jgi:membrane protease YdiL (CAAX protease family)
MLLDREGRLRLLWRVLIYLAGMAGVQLAVAIAVVIGLAIYLPLKGERIELEEIDDWTLPITIFAAPLITSATVALTFVCRRCLDRRSMTSMGVMYPIPRPAATLLGGTLAGGAPILAATAILIAAGAMELNGLGGDWLALPIVPTLILMAFYEEITFRGYLLQNFVEADRPKLGVLVTSVLFWLAHSLNPAAWVSPVNSLNLFGAGVALALIYLISRNLWLPTAVHFGWNATQGVLLNVPISGIETPGWIQVERRAGWPDWMTGGNFGLEGSLVALTLLAVMTALLTEIYRRQPRPDKPADAIYTADVVPDSENPEASPQ